MSSKGHSPSPCRRAAFAPKLASLTLPSSPCVLQSLQPSLRGLRHFGADLFRRVLHIGPATYAKRAFFKRKHRGVKIVTGSLMPKLEVPHHESTTSQPYNPCPLFSLSPSTLGPSVPLVLDSVVRLFHPNIWLVNLKFRYFRYCVLFLHSLEFLPPCFLVLLIVFCIPLDFFDRRRLFMFSFDVL